MDDIRDENSAMAGFRLQYLEVLNWGTFNHHLWRIAPGGQNSLLTGDIGSGKSTLVDALTSLLVPHYRIIYNKAAGAESKERNLLTYVRGEYKKEKEEITQGPKKIYLRPDDNTYSIILANFFNEGFQEHVCLAQVFWVKDGKVEKLLLISSEPLLITEHFKNFADIPNLRKRLRGTPGVTLFDDNFSRYSDDFRHRFGMTSDKAIDLFYQTVSMKAVSSLTEFVRDQMLEKTDVKEQIAVLLKRFDELNKAHTAVVVAREQYGLLKPLVEYSVQYGALGNEIESMEKMLGILPVWFAEKKILLYETAIEETNAELQSSQAALDATRNEIDDLEDKQVSLRQDIKTNGGARIDQIRDEIRRRSVDKDTKNREWENYQILAKRSGLPGIDSEAGFNANLRQGKIIFDQCIAKEQDLQHERDAVVISQRQKQDELQNEESELSSLLNRKSAIPRWLEETRSILCEDLEIQVEELPFGGELLKVRDDESDWEGAIERLLHDFGVSMLVPAAHYQRVRSYVNANTLRSRNGMGVKLTYLEADINAREGYLKQLDDDSVYYKVEVKPDNPFERWVESHLQRSFGEYVCVDVSDMDNVPFGLTKKGLIKTGKIRHIKNDRSNIHDRKNYVLGWTNEDKIRALEDAIYEIKSQLKELSLEMSGIEKQQKTNQDTKETVKSIIDLKDYGLINWQHEVEKIYALGQEQKELLENNDRLKLLEKTLREVEQALKEMKQNADEKNRYIGKLEERVGEYEKHLASCRSAAQSADEAIKGQYYVMIDEKMTEWPFTLDNADAIQEQVRKQIDGDNGELRKLRSKHNKLATQIVEKMRDIKDHSKAEYSEFSATVEARGEYIDKFNRLVNEDLKRHEDRFKEELNRNTIHSIAVFDTQLEKHEKDIRTKIGHINQHLREIVYDSAKETYITILTDPSTNKELRTFREDLKLCYVNALPDGSDHYREDKYEQVKRILDRFASQENVDREWTNNVTDVRKWFDFNASERYLADDTEKEFYEGSGGKSGGQKEKLAYTILASALAYQFGLQFGENKSRTFRFVVIDEAFGRGSDESTRYGLELFRKLNLQLLIVTPLQKIHIIENHVSNFHFVSNRDGNNSQVTNLSVREYKEEKEKRSNILAKEIINTQTND